MKTSQPNSPARAPFWLVPKPVRFENNLSLLDEWFLEEDRYCSKKLSLSALIASIALAFCVYLDIHYDPPADFWYSLRGRGFLSLCFLFSFLFIRFKSSSSNPLKFVSSKAFFSLSVMAAVAYQFQYSEDFANRARYLPAAIFILGVYAARVGPSFTALFCVFYLSIMMFFNIRYHGHFQEDLNHFTLGAVAVFFFQNRIYYEARNFVSEWKEKQRLAEAESEAKILASHAYGELTKLVYPHVVNLIQSGKVIEETMPAGHAKAAVLCLDVIDSSQILHPHFPKAMEDFQGLLYDLMCENYDGKKFQSNGYRIKDVGDGVYYSVGFPFSLLGDISPNSAAVEFAFRTVTLFHRVMSNVHSSTPISCGIGIAFGDIEGFFPTSGLSQYDIRGRAIILANRYQGFRKRLAELHLSTPGQSIIVISRDVFASLPPPQARRFAELRLDGKGLTIRNDNGAGFVYWTAIPNLSTQSQLEQIQPIETKAA